MIFYINPIPKLPSSCNIKFLLIDEETTVEEKQNPTVVSSSSFYSMVCNFTSLGTFIIFIECTQTVLVYVECTLQTVLVQKLHTVLVFYVDLVHCSSSFLHCRLENEDEKNYVILLVEEKQNPSRQEKEKRVNYLKWNKFVASQKAVKHPSPAKLKALILHEGAPEQHEDGTILNI